MIQGFDKKRFKKYIDNLKENKKIEQKRLKNLKLKHKKSIDKTLK